MTNHQIDWVSVEIHLEFVPESLDQLGFHLHGLFLLACLQVKVSRRLDLIKIYLFYTNIYKNRLSVFSCTFSL